MRRTSRPALAAPAKRSGFTLLEVMLAVAILGLITLSIYRFLEVNLTAITAGSKASDENAQMQTLSALIRQQLLQLPSGLPGALLGDAHKFQEKGSDELSWLCGPGQGLFTRHASGLFRVRLMLRPTSKTGTELELGLRRQPAFEETTSKENWLPLLMDVDALEFRYFDPRLNGWVEKWTDQGAKPALVRMRLWRKGDTAPYEEVFALPKQNVGPRPPQQPNRPPVE